jgi:hypothetical protein
MGLHTLSARGVLHTADTRAIEEIAVNVAAKMGLAKLIDDCGNAFGIAGTKAVELDERRVPTFNFFSDDLDRVVDNLHLTDCQTML